jgi:hypothetical protein
MDQNTFNKLNRYVNVRLQQGVPLLDADWNEQDDIRKYELQAFIKWFVGNGVPQGSDAFKIKVCSPATNDFEIVGSTQNEADKKDDMRCLVEGLEVFNEKTRKYNAQNTEQTLVELPELKPPSEGERTDIVYLDIWEREVDSKNGKPFPINATLGVSSCTRIKREWVVRVAEGARLADFSTEYMKRETKKLFPEETGQHVYYALALLKRKTNSNITDDQIIDLRTTCAMLSQPNVNSGLCFEPRITAKQDNQELTALRINPTFNKEKDSFTIKNKYGLVVEKGDVKFGTTTSKTQLSIEGSLQVTENIGIGTTTTPQAKLQVVGGAIMPAHGNSENAGILFPKDPHGGSNDRAWIRYYPSSGENMTLEIGTSDNPEDHIVLNPGQGNVGIGNSAPTAKLHVQGTLQLEKGEKVNEFTNDMNSNDNAVPTVKAVKDYVQNQLKKKPDTSGVESTPETTVPNQEDSQASGQNKTETPSVQNKNSEAETSRSDTLPLVFPLDNENNNFKKVTEVNLGNPAQNYLNQKEGEIISQT